MASRSALVLAFAGPEPRCSAPIIGHRLGPDLLLGEDTLDAEGHAFYRGAHRAAIRAMLDHVHDS